MTKVLLLGKDVKARRSKVKELINLKLSALELHIKLQLLGEHKAVCILRKQIKKCELTSMEEKYHVHRPLTTLVQGAEYAESA